MDFVDVLRVLGRRWLIVLLGLVLTGAAGFYAIATVLTQYQAKAQYVMLLPSSANGVSDPVNPYINLNGGLIFASTLIVSDMGTKEVARSMVKNGFESDYSVATGTSGGPVLDVMVEGTDPVDVLETRNELLRRFDEELDSLQDISGVPDRQLIFSRTNAVDPVAEVVPGAKKKALLLITAVGGVLTLIMVFVLDGLLLRRKARKLARKEAAAAEEKTPADPPDEAVEKKATATSATVTSRPDEPVDADEPDERDERDESTPRRFRGKSVSRAS